MFDLDSLSESKIDDLSANLYSRIMEETERLLKSQLEKLGVDVENLLVETKLMGELGPDFIQVYYPDDPKALFSYQYNGKPILGARISDNGMAIEWDVPEIETQSKGEVQ